MLKVVGSVDSQALRPWDEGRERGGGEGKGFGKEQDPSCDSLQSN